MPALPTGTLTLLFTDIEGSTRLVQTVGATRYAGLQADHRRLMRAAFAAHGGREVDTQGDAFFVVFRRAADAVAAAIDAQRALAAHPWPADGEVRVRMGLHTGEPVRTDEGYVGVALNQGARVCAVAHGGQAFLSSACRDALTTGGSPGEPATGWSCRDLGEHRLKDIRHIERLYQVVAPGMADVSRPPATVGDRHPRDRILVRESADPRSLPDAMRALLRAVRGDAEGEGVEGGAPEGGSETVTLSPADLQSVVAHPATDLTTFWLGRVAEWSLPRYQLDDRFVALTLLVDQGEEAVSGRWKVKEERFTHVGEVLAKVPDRPLVLLGPPGSGKSTLLRRFELDTAIEGLRAPEGRPKGGTLTFFLPLNQYRASRPGDRAPFPRDWLSERWAARYPSLPPLADLLSAGRMILLLDALNEMPHATDAEYRAHVGLWRHFVVETARDHPANRILFSCRSLDYSAPLSTPELRVPQVTIEPLTDAGVEALVKAYSPAQAQTIWGRLKRSPQLAAVRSPYFLKLLVDQVEATGLVPEGPAGLFTGFVRQALRREIERDNPLFRPDSLLTERDCRRLVRLAHGSGWRTAWELPERGALVPRLEALAFGMQLRAGVNATSQVRVEYETALGLIDHERDEDIVKAGLDLAVLDEDVGREEITYFHQLLQEYFAARSLSEAPNPALVRAAWRASEIRPSARELIGKLAPADTLPPLPTTGWEETTVLAAAMAAEPEPFIRGVMATNLALAGRCANQSEARGRLAEAFLEDVRRALVNRGRDPDADLRLRIACGVELGRLGDPRFERRRGPFGEFLKPPLVAIAGGTYPIGADEPIHWTVAGRGGAESGHMPRHVVEVAAFAIGRFPVTNAEWACFAAGGGYEDERWWDTADGRAWRRGELVNEGARESSRVWWRRFRDDPRLFEQQVEAGRYASAEVLDRWRHWVTMDEAAFERAVAERWPPKREVEPEYWRDASYNEPSQPVVGVCWYEARAYCSWLGAQLGAAIRLPTEIEWEAAAGGREGRPYPWGDAPDWSRGNVQETGIRRPTPVGVFPDGDTPEGISDLGGNVTVWTASLWGRESDRPEFGYPYDREDGREDAAAPPDVRRVARGGLWGYPGCLAQAPVRACVIPVDRNHALGLRVACTSLGEG